jgi:hypothetical protein
MAIKHTIIYQSHFELMNNLSDEQAGILIKSIGLFQTGVEPMISDPMVFGIFMAIKRDFIIQSENYEKKKEANRKNGKLGGRPSNPKNPVGYLETQANPQNLKEKERDIDKEKDIDKDINCITGNASVKNSLEDFNKVFGSLE